MMTRDLFFAPRPQVVVPVEIPEWPDASKAFVRRLASRDRVRFYEQLADYGTDPDGLQQAISVAWGLCQEDGTPLLDPQKIEDVVRASTLDGVVMRRLSDAFWEVNGISTAVQDKAKKSPEA